MFVQAKATTVTALVAFSLAVLVSAVPTKRGGLAQVITRCTVPNTAALTFDDGPFTYLKNVVDTLDDAGVKGTFFFNGNNYACIYNSESVDRVQYAYEHGHQIASHTWSHAHLEDLSKGQLDSEFERVEDALEKIIGAVPAFARPPYGEYDDLVREVAEEHGEKLVTWDFDSGDSLGKSAAQSNALYDALVSQRPATILALNHEVYESTVKTVLPHALAVLKKAGYKLVTVAECIGQEPYQRVKKPSGRDASWTCS